MTRLEQIWVYILAILTATLLNVIIGGIFAAIALGIAWLFGWELQVAWAIAIGLFLRTFVMPVEFVK